MTSMHTVSLPSSIMQHQINKTRSHLSQSSIHYEESTEAKNRLCSRSILYPIVAWLLLIILTMLYFIFVCPWYYHDICKLIPILHGLFTFYVIQNFLCSMYTDPGTYHPCSLNQSYDESRLKYETKLYSINNINFDVTQCSICLIVKPPRTHHCRSCDCCIDTMDHHCPWLSNCVGRRNYRFFLLFLFTLLIHINITFICSLYLIVALRDNLLQLKVFISFLLVFCTTVVAGLAGGLFGLHVILVSKNITTLEQVTGKFMNAKQTPYHRSILHNWLRVCCISMIPKLNRSTPKQSMNNNKHFPVTLNMNE